jgi:hypothetical protein
MATYIWHLKRTILEVSSITFTLSPNKEGEDSKSQKL